VLHAISAIHTLIVNADGGATSAILDNINREFSCSVSARPSL
jgi:hypothetical protein